MSKKTEPFNWRPVFQTKWTSAFKEIWKDEGESTLRNHFLSLIESTPKLSDDPILIKIINRMSDTDLSELKKLITGEPNRKARRNSNKK